MGGRVEEATLIMHQTTAKYTDTDYYLATPARTGDTANSAV